MIPSSGSDAAFGVERAGGAIHVWAAYRSFLRLLLRCFRLCVEILLSQNIKQGFRHFATE
jgi:hypothetical protein